MRVVVDTSILIDHLRGSPLWTRHILPKIEAEEAELFAPTIVIFELFSGTSTRSSTTVRMVKELLSDFQIMDLTEDIAKRAGELYRDVDKTLQVPDYIIAASCLSIGGVLVTLNTKHFQQIQGLALYQ